MTTATSVSGADSCSGLGAHGYDSARRQWWLVIVLLVVSTLGAIDRQVIALLVNPIREHLQVTDTQMSVIIGAAFGVSNTLFTLPAGYLADRVSRRGLILAGALVWSLMTMACGTAVSFAQLFLARAGVGFGESVIQPCALSMLRGALSPQRRARGFSVLYMSLTGGSSLALIVGGLLVSVLASSGPHYLPVVGPVRPWQLTLILIGLVGIPAGLLVLTAREPARSADGVRSSAGGYFVAWSLIRSRWKLYVPLLLFQLAMLMLSLSYAAWLPAMVQRLWHLSFAQIGVTLGLMMLLLPPIGLYIAGQWMDSAAARRGVSGPVMVGLFATALVALAATAAPLAFGLSAFWVLFGALMLVSGTVFPLAATVTASITPAASMGKVTAVQFFVTGLFAPVIGPTVVALVSDTFFSGPRALALSMAVVCGVYSFVSLAALVVLLRAIKAAPPIVESDASSMRGAL